MRFLGFVFLFPVFPLEFSNEVVVMGAVTLVRLFLVCSCLLDDIRMIVLHFYLYFAGSSCREEGLWGRGMVVVAEDTAKRSPMV